MTTLASAREVFDYWLGPDPDDPATGESRRELWYRGGVAVDAEIGARFGHVVREALAGAPWVSAWRDSALGQAALVIVLDQFTRNLFRGTRDAWSGDRVALDVAKAAVATGTDRTLPIAARIFLYHPFHHSEVPHEQEAAVQLLTGLSEEAGAGWASYFERSLQSTRGHRDIVVRFGRFPHRNGALGRVTTPEEAAFLPENPNDFGQARRKAPAQ